ncbi:MAG TPA: hypothetical protein VFY68_10860 [Nitrososphaeraceae archaeon]|nr:hypothetical protein [Nitrososphaeraceae archaeon]
MFIIVATKKLGRIVKEVAIIIFQLVKGLIILVGRNARGHGKPAIMRFGRWLKEKTIIFVRWARLKIIQAVQISKVLLILTARELRTRGVSKVKQIPQSLKDSPSRFYRKARETVGEKVNTVKKDNIATEETRASEAEAVPVPQSSEVILREEESISINEKLAREIIQNGIKCEAVTDIGSLRIETKPPYSFLFPRSPRIVTNRGCIRLTQDNERSNIDLIQLIQKN